ncbi:hypothetical protein GWI33_016634 [Rhynchophorus ferrugineus]|uniref:NADP-dependent oxidoreductase domain-containing protein n=1 Tax=Rhynchophorus ferrugineus TaxID=354439 RepID=A0A834I375_RHYFE|nr:hypothetical protein GWI33_016634 [Rhynchophorus ferrugineus]
MLPKTIKLNNGILLPTVGLGTYRSQPGQVEEAVKTAIDAGYRHIDCAWFYGNEPEIYLSLASCGIIFGTKLDAPLLPTENHENYFSDVDYLETWEGLEEGFKLGLAKSIGLSNFNSEQVERVLKNCTVKPVVNQVECNPNLNQKKLNAFCKERGVVLVGFCPLGRSEYVGRPGFPEPTIFDPKVAEIGKKYNKSPAQVVLNYLVGLGISVIPKSVTKARIIENIDIFDFTLSQEDKAYLDSCNKNQRVSALSDFKNHKYYSFAGEF